ncbi:unnamed protein product, partial [Iphiclides podalirius]
MFGGKLLFSRKRVTAQPAGLGQVRAAQEMHGTFTVGGRRRGVHRSGAVPPRHLRRPHRLTALAVLAVPIYCSIVRLAAHRAARSADGRDLAAKNPRLFIDSVSLCRGAVSRYSRPMLPAAGARSERFHT